MNFYLPFLECIFAVCSPNFGNQKRWLPAAYLKDTRSAEGVPVASLVDTRSVFRGYPHVFQGIRIVFKSTRSVFVGYPH